MKTLSLFFMLLSIFSCGKHPADLLRAGQAPIYNFPLYISSGDGTGTIWKYDKNAVREAFVTGLNDPRGIAIDKFQNLYVAETGNSRVLKINLDSKVITVMADNLLDPRTVAVDSFGDVYVNQEDPTALNIMRVKDRKIINTYLARPTAIAFGVNDIMLVGLFETAKVYWGGLLSSPNDSVQEPVTITIDVNGRAFVAEGTATNAKVYRYHQAEPSGKTVVADGLAGVTGIAVDTVGNIYIAEPGNSRIALVTFKNEFFNWTNINVPQGMAFTPY
ncbi:MAG: hypothetical protein ABL930_06180 [Pseudobdellovibrio sp.]